VLGLRPWVRSDRSLNPAQWRFIPQLSYFLKRCSRISGKAREDDRFCMGCECGTQDGRSRAVATLSIWEGLPAPPNHLLDLYAAWSITRPGGRERT
jgi:hypothetical protein